MRSERVALTADDVAGGLALSDAAGWNQTADDWTFFVRAGGAIGERESAGAAPGRLVGTAATLDHGRFGWISMVLVADEHRHRGLASRLVDACIAGLRARGTVPVLDATPAGRPVYASLGFVDGFGFERWEREASGGAAPGGGEALPAAAGLAALDLAASGLDRRAWFADVLGRRGTAVVRDHADGFALLRSGRRALQLGPVVAADEAAAIALVERSLAVAGGARLFIDVPVAREGLGERLGRAGFTRQRPFTRMAQGAAPPPLGARQFAFAGPEFG